MSKQHAAGQARQVVSLHVEGSLVVIEIGVRGDGFLVPGGEVDAEIEGRPGRRCRIDAARSTPRGPHAAGTIVRIALVLDAGETWPAETEVHVTWTDTVAFHLRFTVPAA